MSTSSIRAWYLKSNWFLHNEFILIMNGKIDWTHPQFSRYNQASEFLQLMFCGTSAHSMPRLLRLPAHRAQKLRWGSSKRGPRESWRWSCWGSWGPHRTLPGGTTLGAPETWHRSPALFGGPQEIQWPQCQSKRDDRPFWRCSWGPSSGAPTRSPFGGWCPVLPRSHPWEGAPSEGSSPPTARSTFDGKGRLQCRSRPPRDWPGCCSCAPWVGWRIDQERLEDYAVLVGWEDYGDEGGFI